MFSFPSQEARMHAIYCPQVDRGTGGGSGEEDRWGTGGGTCRGTGGGIGGAHGTGVGLGEQVAIGG